MILGLTGKMGAGKNEAARRLAQLSPIPVVEVSFARKLKESVAALFDISLGVIETMKNEPLCFVSINHLDETGRTVLKELTFREFLQRYGTEAHRSVFGQEFWLDAALPYLDHPGGSYYDDKLYVVTDVRFPNEGDRVRSLGGLIVQIEGPDKDTGDHVSEAGLSDHDWHIDNTVRDDGFENLDSELRELLTHALNPEYA